MTDISGYHPFNIIVDVGVDVSEFMFWLKPFDYLEPDYHDVLTNIIAAIGFEKHWKNELALTCLKLTNEVLGYMPIDACEDDYEKLGLGQHFINRQNETEQIHKQLYKLGSAIQHQLKLLKAYQSGYLYYSFEDFVGKDILLHRLLYESISSQ